MLDVECWKRYSTFNIQHSTFHISNSHIYLALAHYPVYDKHRKVVATSITNYDIHDISRVARTYDLGGYFMVTPLKSQQELCRRIIHHWVEGFGSQYNQTRREAFSTTYLADSLQPVIDRLREKFEATPMIIMTSAREYIARECGKPMLGYGEARTLFQRDKTIPFLLVLGTGYGLTNECIEEYGSMVLAPIDGIAEYNHLSVRTATAIMIDRLFGRE